MGPIHERHIHDSTCTGVIHAALLLYTRGLHTTVHITRGLIHGALLHTRGLYTMARIHEGLIHRALLYKRGLYTRG